MAEEEEEEEEAIMAVEIYCNSLPQEIIIEILSWVPAKSLVTSFKLVCKAWYTLIHDPVFVKMHLNRGAIHGGGGGGVSSCSNNSLICKSGNELFQFHPPFNFEATTTTTIAAAETTTKLDFDTSSLSSNSRLVGSCNGLLCINTKYDKRIILLNPSTRRFKVSPIQQFEYPPNFIKTELVTYGFGCCYNSTDAIDDEYKVIRIVCFLTFSNANVSSQYQFDIYSMSSNSWRRETTLRDYPYIISRRQSGVFVNGALHWMGSNNWSVTSVRNSEIWVRIVSFDIRDEDFRQVPIPLSFERNADNPPSLMIDKVLMKMRGCLAMIWFSNEIMNNMDAGFEIWVMKEYGIKESWTKEFVIRSSDSDPPLSYGYNANVLKGDQILIEGSVVSTCSSFYREKRVLYDINKRKIDWGFKMVGVPYQHSVGYIETLVSLKSMLPLSNNRRGGENCS